MAKLYVEDTVDDWVKSLKTFATMMPNQPQAVFAGYTRSPQFEWAYIQCTIEVEERYFDPLEDAISSYLLAEIFETKQIPSNLWDLTPIPNETWRIRHSTSLQRHYSP
eukprot:6317571-Ditylum_brightwellii.AAC.1